jgi:hypothetical protein
LPTTLEQKLKQLTKNGAWIPSQLVDAVLEELPARIDAPAAVDINRNTP